MITIRRFIPADGESVRQLIVGIMDKEFQDAKDAYPTQDIDHIDQSYSGLGEAFFVAINGNKVVGSVAIKKEDERVALLRRLFVDASYRKQQLGDKLIDRALKFCDEVGYKELVFKTTSQMVGAVKLCQKRGFIQRAKIQLGSLELLKFSLPIRNGLKDQKDN